MKAQILEPWEWVKQYDHYALVDPNGVVIITDGSAQGEYPPEIDVNGPEARLIASAPILLKALDELIHQVEISGAIDQLGHALKNLQALHDAKAAIHKAKAA